MRWSPAVCFVLIVCLQVNALLFAKSQCFSDFCNFSSKPRRYLLVACWWTFGSWQPWNHGRPQGEEKRAFPISLEIETKNQGILGSMMLSAQFRSIDVILTMPVYLPLWHSHCTTASFTVLVSFFNELAVHSCPLLCVSKLGREFFGCWSYCVTNLSQKPRRKADISASAVAYKTGWSFQFSNLWHFSFDTHFSLMLHSRA